MKKLNLTVDDILESMRGLGYFSLDQVEFAIMETNGKLSVLPKAEYAPATNESVKAKVEKSAIPVNLICEGKLMKENLPVAKVDEAFVLKFLKDKNKKAKLKDVLVMTLGENGQVYLQYKTGGKQIYENVRVA